MGAAISQSHCCSAVKGAHIFLRRPSTALSPSYAANRKDGDEGPARGSTGVVLTKTHFCDDSLRELIKRYPLITHARFDVHNNDWIPTDIDLAKLKALPNLTSIDLTGCHEITRRGLEYFSLEPGQIRILILTGCPKITDKFFDHIVHFSHLERLDVRGCFRISDHGIEALRSLRFLRHLDISVLVTGEIPSGGGPSITNASMTTVSRLINLTTLHMECCLSVNEDGLMKLVTLRNVTSLNVASTGLTDAGLKLLKNLPELRQLNVGSCYLSESQLGRHLATVPRLNDLNVSKVIGVTDNFLKTISESLKLKTLNISGCGQLSDACLNHLNGITSLKHLIANDCPGIGGAALSRLSRLTKLRALRMNEATDIHYDDLLALGALTELEIGARCADEEQLSKLSELPDLTDLIIHLSTEGSSCCTRIMGVKVTLLHHSSLMET